MTSDVTQMIAQVPALFESLTGVRIGDLMRQVPQIREAVDGPSRNGASRQFQRGTRA